MHGTVPQKIGRIISNLVLHPQYISRCINHNLLNGKTPLDLELPWFSYAAIDFLEDFLQPHMTVCEYGSGGSTLFFSRRVKSVYSIEDNPKWFDLVSGRLQQQGVRNATLTLHPFDFKKPGRVREIELPPRNSRRPVRCHRRGRERGMDPGASSLLSTSRSAH